MVLPQAIVSVTGPTFVEATPIAGGFSVTIPDFNAQSYAVLSSFNATDTDDSIAAGPAAMRFTNAPLLRETANC